MTNYYLVIDIGTGNFRVGLVSSDGEIQAIKKKDMYYETSQENDLLYYFNPDYLIKAVKELIISLVKENPDIKINGITSTSQRQGIVLINQNGKAFLGIPNIDKRAKRWEPVGEERRWVYKQVARQPTSLYPALKLIGLKNDEPFVWEKVKGFTSISDWIGYEFTKALYYERSQASETLLLDIEHSTWSEELIEYWGIEREKIPPLIDSGSILGIINEKLLKELGINENIPFLVGGADTQLALKGMTIEVGEVAIISGTTSPVIQLANNYFIDSKERCSINLHTSSKKFLVETNGGATGLNYQRMKNFMFPDQSYHEIEVKMKEFDGKNFISSFSTLDAVRGKSLTNGGFLIPSPFPADLRREDLMYSVLLDMAFTITSNFRILEKVTGHSLPYLYGCGGGFRSMILPQLLANLLEKEIIVKEGFEEATIRGAIQICNETLNIAPIQSNVIKRYTPIDDEKINQLYKKWMNFRESINK